MVQGNQVIRLMQALPIIGLSAMIGVGCSKAEPPRAQAPAVVKKDVITESEIRNFAAADPYTAPGSWVEAHAVTQTADEGANTTAEGASQKDPIFGWGLNTSPEMNAEQAEREALIVNALVGVMKDEVPSARALLEESYRIASGPEVEGGTGDCDPYVISERALILLASFKHFPLQMPVGFALKTVKELREFALNTPETLLKKYAEQTDKSIADLKLKQEQLDTKLGIVKADLQKLQDKQIKDLEVTNKALEKQNGDLKNTNNNLVETNKVLSKTNEDLKLTSKHLEEVNAALVKQIKEAREVADSAQKTLNEQKAAREEATRLKAALDNSEAKGFNRQK